MKIAAEKRAAEGDAGAYAAVAAARGEGVATPEPGERVIQKHRRMNGARRRRRSGPRAAILAKCPEMGNRYCKAGTYCRAFSFCAPVGRPF